MSDGRYVFRHCVPDGAIDIANVSQGDTLNRAWSWRVNDPPDLQSELDGGAFDPRSILTGSDGELWDGDGNFLAEVNQWQAQMNFTNSDYQPAGKKITWGIPQSYSVTLTFVETVVRDARLLKKLMDAIKANQQVSLTFIGVLRAH